MFGMGRSEEMVDLVDEGDRVVGVAPRSEVRSRNLLHREVAAICRNAAGAIYVHRRTETKDVFPSMHDMWVAGVVSSGETYAEAVRRELREELGISGAEPVFLFKHRYRDDHLNWWTEAFEVRWDGPIRHQPEEVAWGAFLPEAELLAKLDEWAFVPDGVDVFRRYLRERAER